MASRTLALIRRGINRLYDLLTRRGSEHPALQALTDVVAASTTRVNASWQQLQELSVSGDRERAERDSAVAALRTAVQQWRPVIFVRASEAAKNISTLPSGGGTVDDLVRIANDMVKLVDEYEGLSSIREAVAQQLGAAAARAEKESAEALEAYPAELRAQEAYTQACMEANEILVHGSRVVRATFGSTSPEYRQFITRGTAAEEDEIDAESAVEDKAAA